MSTKLLVLKVSSSILGEQVPEDHPIQTKAISTFHWCSAQHQVCVNKCTL